MSTALNRFASDERGFTLFELLATMLVGGLVLTATLKLSVDGMNATGKVRDREAGAQTIRVGMHRIVSLIDAQVCNGSTAPITAANANQMVFTAQTGTVDSAPVGYRLRYDSATKRVLEDRYTLTASAAGGSYSWPAGAPGTPNSTRVVLQDVVPGPSGAVFAYYKVDDAATGVSVPIAAPATGSIAAADRDLVTRIDTTLQPVMPNRGGTAAAQARRGTRVSAQTYVLSGVNPEKLSSGPCTG